MNATFLLTSELAEWWGNHK